MADAKPSVHTYEPDTDLAPVPAGPSVVDKIKRFGRSLVSRDAWVGDHDYAALLIPTIPYLTKTDRVLPFYGVHDKVPYLLLIILGLQHALAMVGGVVTPPLLLGGSSGANLGNANVQYLISASLIWCAVGTAVQASRFRLGKTRYFLGTGIISVTGTSFAFVNVGLSYLSQAYASGVCPVAEDGTLLPCPREFGAILGTACVTSVIAFVLAFIPPKAIRRLFPPLVVGMMLFLIGASLVKSGVTNWAGGSGPCMTNHALMCPSNTAPVTKHPWGSAPLIGLGFSAFATIIICELFGGPFIKSASVFTGLVVGMVIAAATGYFNGATIKAAPSFTFLWVKTFPLGIRGQLVLPMLAAWTVICAETIGNVTASCDVSQLPIEGEEFETRVQGGMLADAISAMLAPLATITPLTTFSQNAGVIALTRNANRNAAYVCAFFLLLMGIVAKFASVFVAMPPSVVGGFTTFLFGSVAVSGIRVMAYAKWDRRARFISTCGMSLGLASLCVPKWFSYFFTYAGNNSGLQGLIQAIVLIVEEPYLIASLIAILLNALLPHEKAPEEQQPLQQQQASDAASSTSSSAAADGDDVKVAPAAHSAETWNSPGPVLGRH
ncbi:putative purine permease [Acaromyces ingoldii]|uniref:Putative purine permease n=1 Tax=Acaromyces ingoldii TaxID=215250 RepID=A0A316YU59_9BASI|nr:putative purine permease [Acaromyces ingoldii]PWN92596.1 putative purine permease [Acaromyces ingoldii]